MRKLPTHGRYEWHGDVPISDDPEDGEYLVIKDVTDMVTKLVRTANDQAQRIDALQKQLADIMNRKSWEELKLVTDERTGMSVVTMVTYQWEAKHMRLDMTREAMNMSRGGW